MPKEKSKTTNAAGMLSEMYRQIEQAARTVRRAPVQGDLSPNLSLPSYQEYVETTTTYGIYLESN